MNYVVRCTIYNNKVLDLKKIVQFLLSLLLPEVAGKQQDHWSLSVNVQL